MTTDETAEARDAEVARLHPGAARKHVRATFPARVVLRGVEKQEGLEEVPLIGKTVLTAAVDERGIHFYSGADPVQDAGRIDAADVVGVGTATEMNASRPLTQQVLRLSVAGVGMHPVDVDLEVFDLDGGGLRPTTDLPDEVTSWAALLGRR
jgi:hypothetical protein